MTFTTSNTPNSDEPLTIPGSTRTPSYLVEQFQAIKYERRKSGTTAQPGLTLSGRYWVEKGYFELAWDLVWAHFHSVNWSRKQTAERLCNDPDWKKRPRGQRLKLGRCIKYFATEGLLPIWECNPGKSGMRKYQLSPN
jgi:hypothetical protein